jgi:hypothetical protein
MLAGIMEKKARSLHCIGKFLLVLFALFLLYPICKVRFNMSICDTEARLFLEAGLKSTIGLLGITFLRHSTVSH